MFQYRVLREVFGPWREGVRGDWRKVLVRSFIFILLNKCYPDDHMKENEMGQGMWHLQGRREICTADSEGKRPFVRPRGRWDYNLKIHLQDIGWQVENWIGLAQDRDNWQALVSIVIKLVIP
jgi:hypothetical protein